MKFPVTIRHRTGKVKIYAPANNFTYYRLSFTVAGKRQMQTFAIHTETKTAGEAKVKEIHNNSTAAALSASQSRDALAALQRLESFLQSIGKRLSLLAVVSEHVGLLERLSGRSLGEAVEGYLQTVVSVRRKDHAEGVEDFLTERQHTAVAKDGERSQLSASYETRVAGWLWGFAGTFQATAVSDLTKEHINLYFKPLAEISAKNRNDRRATVRMFLTWVVRQDFLSVNHRLLEASGMTRETVEAADTDFSPGRITNALGQRRRRVAPGDCHCRTRRVARGRNHAAGLGERVARRETH